MSEAVSDVVTFTIADGIGELRLNRAEKMNALTPEMMVRLDRAWAQLREAADVRVAIVSGAGERAFCTGADLNTLVPLLTGGRAPQDEWDEAVLGDPALLGRALLRAEPMPVPLIAAMNGFVLGGGLELMLACDLRVAGTGCQFGLPEVRWGLIPGAGGTVRLSRQVSQAQAAEVLLLGDPIDSVRALEIGLVNRVVAADQVLATARALAGRMAENGVLAMRTIKGLMLESSGLPLDAAFAVEDGAIATILRSGEAAQASRKFEQR